MDKFKNARIQYPTGSTEDIAAVAFPNAASAMLLTTSTTAVAFFASCICPVPPIFVRGVLWSHDRIQLRNEYPACLPRLVMPFEMNPRTVVLIFAGGRQLKRQTRKIWTL